MTFIAPVYRLPLCILVRSLYGSMSPPLIPLSWYFLPSRWRFRSLSPAYDSVVGGLLISGLLVIPCISAGTLAISVGSKVILSNFLWFPDDNISVTLLFFGCSHQSHPTMPRIEQCLHPEFLYVPEYDKVISDALPSFSQSW